MLYNIKRSRYYGIVLWAGLFLMIVASCRKEQYAATDALPTLQQYIGQDTSLSLFQLALERSGLDTVLSGGGPYTIFAPENSAFLKAGLSADKINGYDRQQLFDMIGYQVVIGRIGSATLQGFTSDSAVTLNKYYQPIVTLNYYGLFINGIAVTQGNIALADGILHKIGQIASPPTGDLLRVLDSLPDTKMAAYIFNQSPGLRAFITNPAAVFANNNVSTQDGAFSIESATTNNSCTLLVPSDAAFQAYGFNTPADLAALDSVTRTNLILNGILFGTFFTSDFIGGQNVGYTSNSHYKLAPGKTFIVDLAVTGLYYYDAQYQSYNQYNLSNAGQAATYEFGNDGLTLYGNGILTPPMIVQSNIVTTVGVLHVINQVFAPVGSYSPGN